MQPQQTAFQQPQGYGGFQGQQQPGMPNGFMPQQTGVQAMQQNFPALQPQPTGLNFQPQSSFGQQQQTQLYGAQPYQQQQLMNGAQTGSPFADPPRQPYQPNAPSGLQNSFMPQPTGFQQQQTGYPQQQQPSFNIAAPTGMNGGYGAQPQPGAPPQLPPQQTGGVFGPSQPLTSLVPQKTGPAPPVRFGVPEGGKKLMPQPTGRANLAKASKFLRLCLYVGGADRLCSSAESVWVLVYCVLARALRVCCSACMLSVICTKAYNTGVNGKRVYIVWNGIVYTSNLHITFRL